MRERTICVSLLCLTFALPAAAATVSVDCSAGQTIGGAIASLGLVGSNTINVSGACVENVVIDQRQGITINGMPGTTLSAALPNLPPLAISGSRSVTVNGLTVSGGRPLVLVTGSTGVTLERVTANGGAGAGLLIQDASRVQASGLTVAHNRGVGIAVFDGSALAIDTSTVENNSHSGISVAVSQLAVAGGDGTPGSETYIRNNGGNGIGASGTSNIEVADDVRIEDNGGNGIQAIHTTSLFISGQTLIAHNGSDGIYLGETSHGELDTATIRDNGANADAATGRDGIHVADNSDFYLDGAAVITGNAERGVSVDDASLFSSLGGNTIAGNGGDGVAFEVHGTGHWYVTDAITGNVSVAIRCDLSSLIVGDISGVAPQDVACARVERRPAATRHGSK